MDWLKRPVKYIVVVAGVGVIAYYAYHKIVVRERSEQKEASFSYSHLLDKSLEMDSTPDIMLPDDSINDTMTTGNLVSDQEISFGELVINDDDDDDDNLGQSSVLEDVEFADKKKCKKILLLGLERSGKSCLLANLSRNMKEAEYVPTKGYNVVCISHEAYNISMWEIGGCPLYRVYWRNFCATTDLVLFVIDASDQDKFPQAKEYIFEIVTELEDGVDFHIVALKTDDVNAVPVQQLEDILGVKQLNIPVHSLNLSSGNDDSSVQTLLNCCLTKYASTLGSFADSGMS